MAKDPRIFTAVSQGLRLRGQGTGRGAMDQRIFAPASNKILGARIERYTLHLVHIASFSEANNGTTTIKI